MKIASAVQWQTLEQVTAPRLFFPTIGQIVGKIIPYILAFAGVALLLYLIFGGFSYMLSRGDPKATAIAKGKITSALIGFFIVFFAYFIVRFVALFFNIQPVLNTFR